jgi:isochorismate pyruvate lyase
VTDGEKACIHRSSLGEAHRLLPRHPGGLFDLRLGTAPVADDGTTFAPGDGYHQTKRCLEIIHRALRELGASLEDVVRTRMYVTDIGRFEEYARAHGETFGAHPPATAMVEIKALVSPDMLIEVEADAVVDR